MKTVALVSQKGGAGKSTIALHLATLALADAPTLLIDTDPQGSLVFWGERREAAQPLIIPIGAARLAEVLDTARDEGITYCIVDTPPHDSATAATVMRAADLVVIPSRPNALDLHAITATIEMATTLRRRAIVVLNQCPPRRAFGDPQAVQDARLVISSMGGKNAQTFIAQRVVAAQSVIVGQSVSELDPDGPSAEEFAALWREIKGELDG